MEAINLKILFILTFGLAYASLFGYLAYKLKLSPIIGYLLAGFLIGPFSPGFIADLELAGQLAEIGVVLMMFGVGLHFKWQDLLSTANVTVPGAILQTFLTTLLTVAVIHYFGWSIQAGIILGMAIGVSSTVVLLRVLSDNGYLHTSAGHICVGWTIVEDIFTVAVLLILPALAKTSGNQNSTLLEAIFFFSLAILKFAILAVFMLTLGRKVVSYLFSKIIDTHSHELFTLTILAVTFLIATGSAVLLGTSIALGALLAGMVIGQTEMKDEVVSSSTPLKDIFLVVFFLSIGMLFNPEGIYKHFSLFLSILGIILIIKPLTGYCINVSFNYSQKTALIIGLALAQIGEFSFILTEAAMKYDIIPDEAYDIIVACSLISICLNPLLLKILKARTSEN